MDKDKTTWQPPEIVDEPFAEAYDDPVFDSNEPETERSRACGPDTGPGRKVPDKG